MMSNCVVCSSILKHKKYICIECEKKHNVKEEEIIERMENYGTGAI